MEGASVFDFNYYQRSFQRTQGPRGGRYKQAIEEKVYPIKDDETLDDVLDTLMNNYQKSGPRNYMFFVFGMITLLRCSDVCNMKVSDVYMPNGKVKIRAKIRDIKTGKTHFIYYKPMKKQLQDYYEWRENFLKQRRAKSIWLFPSVMYPSKNISVNQFYKIMQHCGDLLGIDYLGSHTMRKTGAYRVYQQSNKDIALVMTLLNHSNERMTLRYLGLDQETKQMALDSVDWGLD